MYETTLRLKLRVNGTNTEKENSSRRKIKNYCKVHKERKSKRKMRNKKVKIL
jgi:hypothetical protein